MFTIDEYYKDNSIPLSLKNYLYLITTGMILNYGEQYIEDIYRTVFSTNFKIYSNLQEDNLFYINPLDNNYMEKKFVFDKSTNSFVYTILFREISNSPIKTLEYLTFQLNYIMFNRHKKKSLRTNLKMKFSLFNANIIFREDNRNNVMENILNVIQTEAIIKEILKLNINGINNDEFKKLILNFEDVDINSYQMEGIDILANLFKPLYQSDMLKELIDSYDNLELLKNEFNRVLGKNAYKIAYGRVKMIYDAITKNKMDNNYFELSEYYVDVRNNIVNRYIALKGI